MCASARANHNQQFDWPMCYKKRQYNVRKGGILYHDNYFLLWRKNVEWAGPRTHKM